MKVWPENHWREVWHDAPCRGMMKRHRETLTIEDGAVLTRYECLMCGEQCFAGVGKGSRVVTRPAAARPPEA